MILVSHCHFGDCHYINANHWTEKRIQRVQQKMAKLGVQPERLQPEWISTAEGIRLADTMHRLETWRQGVTPQEIAETIELLANDSRSES